MENLQKTKLGRNIRWGLNTECRNLDAIYMTAKSGHNLYDCNLEANNIQNLCASLDHFIYNSLLYKQSRLVKKPAFGLTVSSFQTTV